MKQSKHHYVPQLYLRKFCQPVGDRILFEYAKSCDGFRRRSPRDAAAEPGFNSFSYEKGKPRDDRLEQILAATEHQLAPSFEKFISGSSENEHRSDMAYLMALQLKRVKIIRDHFLENAEYFKSVNVAVNYIEQRQHQWRHKVSKEAAEKLIRDIKERGVGFEPDLCSFALFSMEGIEQLASLIHGMEWTVESAEKDGHFITSDNPVFARRPAHLLDPYFVGVAKDEMRVEIGFPLTRSKFLLCRWGRAHGLFRKKASRARCDALNNRTVLSAQHSVYSSCTDELVQRLVRNHRDFVAKPFNPVPFIESLSDIDRSRPVGNDPKSPGE